MPQQEAGAGACYIRAPSLSRFALRARKRRERTLRAAATRSRRGGAQASANRVQ